MGQHQHRPKRPRRRFTDEFKRDAVAMVVQTGRPIAHVARELGIYDSSLNAWIKAAERVAGPAAKADAEQARIEQLEAELAEAWRERDLLKRTVAFWVKESTP